MTTKNGLELAIKLKLTDPQSVETCGKICRAARSYARIQEDMCNGHPIQGTNAPIEQVRKAQARWDARCDQENDRLEKLIRSHAAKLPGVAAVRFQGDPRGCTVKLLRPQDSQEDFSSDGVPVPGS